MESADADLVARAREELPHATRSFEQLAKHRLPQAQRIAAAIVGDLDDAQSVAQDALLRVFHGLPKLREVELFDAWFRRIVVNVARTHLAREQREREKAELASLEREDTVELEEPSSSSAVFGEMLGRLSVEERSILALKFVEDLEFNEIAEIIGAKLSATKMRYYRALNKLEQSATNEGPAKEDKGKP